MCQCLAKVLENGTYELNFFAEAERLESESLGVGYVLRLDSLVNVGLGHAGHLLSESTLFLIILLLIF